jgi:hypothetical protein
MFFIAPARSIQQIIVGVCNSSFDLVVELITDRKVSILAGCKMVEGAVVGRSSDLIPVEIPIAAIRAILRINGEKVSRDYSPITKTRAPIESYGDDQVFLDSPILSPAFTNYAVR